MNPMVRRVLVAALAMVPSVAFAQVPQQVITDNKVTYGLGAGVSVPVGDAEKGLERGVVAHGFARFRLTDTALIPRVDLEYQKFDLKSDASSPSGNAQMIAGTFGLQLFLGGATSIRPYLVGGIGAYHLKFETDGTSLTPGTSESKTRFGLNGGGGIRLANVLNDEGPVDSDLQVVPFTIGVTF